MPFLGADCRRRLVRERLVTIGDHQRRALARTQDRGRAAVADRELLTGVRRSVGTAADDQRYLSLKASHDDGLDYSGFAINTAIRARLHNARKVKNASVVSANN